MEDLINISALYYNKALDYVEENKISSAKRELEKAVNIYSDDVDTLNLLGLCEYYSCDFNKAALYWRTSLNIRKDNYIASKYIDIVNSDKFKNIMDNYNLGIEYFYKSKYKEAIDIFEEILTFEEKFIEVYEILVMSYKGLNDKKNMKKYIELINSIDDENYFIEEYKNIISEEYKDIVKEEKNKHKKTTVLLLVLVIISIGLNLFGYYRYNNLYKEINSIKSINLNTENNDDNK